MNDKGFTLVELLATMAILAILAVLAVPNIIGVVNTNKNKTYVADAKKLVTLAEYKISSNPNVKPTMGNAYCLYMSYLDKSMEMTDAPNSEQYDRILSYVKVSNLNGIITYKVQLVEKKGANSIGIGEVESTKLFEDKAASNLTDKAITSCTGASKYYWHIDSDISTIPVESCGAYC